MKPILTSLIFFAFLCIACKKESFITSADARVSITADTLHFDTVFTSVGSITQSFKIKNGNNQKLKLSNVTLKGGVTSSFKINVDGTSGPQVNDIEIEANDSIYVFVSVSINPNLANLPFIVQDSIEVGYNGNHQLIQLEAYGQNAHFLRNGKISGNVTWTNDLPYVIIGALQVDTTATLTIAQGCKVYLHADAPFIVDGTLAINGNFYDSTRVYFKGDRLDDPFNGYPAAWPGIYFRGTSKDNVLHYAVIKNAYQGVVAIQPAVTANPKVTLNECIIDNIYDIGLYGIQSSISARNCLISNCGKNVALVYGGSYQFLHCTIADSSNYYVQHKNPALYVSNNVLSGTTLLTSDLTASFKNCIIWGNSDSSKTSLVPDDVITSKQGSTVFNVSFDHCLWKVTNVPANATLNTIINNQYPQFDSINVQKRFFSFRLKDNSPALDKAVNAGVTNDLDGKTRPLGLPDIGCYERQ